MERMAIIARKPLRAEIRRVLLGRLLSGRLEPNARINEGKLAAELGVSRTPLREALINLEFEGFIDSEPGKGFSVAPLRAKTAQELHVLVGLLEGEAMRSLATVSKEELTVLVERLREINREMEEEAERGAEEDPERIIELGNGWHAILTGACDNEQLHEVLDLIKQRLYRYTYCFVEQGEQVESKLHQHEEIIEALTRGDIDGAIRLLQAHWLTGAEPLSAWLRESE